MVGIVANIITDVSEWLDEFSANWWFLLIIFSVALLDSVLPDRPRRDDGDRWWRRGRCRQPDAGARDPRRRGRRVPRRQPRLCHRRPLRTSRPGMGGTQAEPCGTDRLRRAPDQEARRHAADHRPVHPRRAHDPHGVVRHHPATTSVVRCAGWRSPVSIWATYAAGLGYLFGQAFEDNHAAGVLAGVRHRPVDHALVEIIRWIRDRGAPTAPSRPQR